MRAQWRANLVSGALLVAAGVLSGCASRFANVSSAYASDRPAPPGEPQASLSVSLSLASAADCEERFDLALYNNSAVVLVEWQPALAPCERRLARVRYLSRRISAEQLLALVSRHATRAVRVDPPPAF